MTPGNADHTQWQVVRPELVLLAAQGLRNEEIAARVQCPREVVTQWREWFYERCMEGLDQPHPSAPPKGTH